MANLSHLPALWRKSGLSQREFCKREHIRLATFSYWRSKELRQTEAQRLAPAAAAAASFTEVVVAARRPAAHVIEITYSDGTHVRIPLPGC